MGKTKDLSHINKDIYKSVIKKLSRDSVCPCSSCGCRSNCEAPQECTKYKKWVKEYRKGRNV